MELQMAGRSLRICSPRLPQIYKYVWHIIIITEDLQCIWSTPSKHYAFFTSASLHCDHVLFHRATVVVDCCLKVFFS